MKEDIEKLEKQLEFSEQRNALYNNLENKIFDACYKFQEEFMNWDKLQEEFADEHDCEIFINEIVDEVLAEMGNQGICL